MRRMTRRGTCTGGSRLGSGLTVWFLSASFYAYGFAQRGAPSVMVEELMADFGATAGSVGAVSASFLYAYALLQLPLGILLDRFGTRRVFVGAAVVCAVGSFLFASAQHILVAHVGRAFLGAGAGVAWVGTLKLASAWFDVSKFALLTGATLSFGMLGAVLGQGPLAAVLGIIGWRSAMLIGAGIAVLFIFLLARLPSGDEAVLADGGEGANVELLRGVTKVVRHRFTWYAAIYGAFMTFPMLGFATLWGVPYLMERFGVTRPIAGLATSLLLVGWGIGAPLFGYSSGRTDDRRRLMITGASINLFTIVAVLYVPGLSFGAVATLLLLNGIGSGSMPLCFALARGYQPPHLAASAFGFVNGLVIMLPAFIQPIIGAIMDLTWTGTMRDATRYYELSSYRFGLSVIPVAVAVALILATLIREPRAQASVAASD